MKYFSILLIVMASACGSSKNNSSSNPSNPAARKKNTIQIKVNEEKTIQFPSSKSSGPQMAFTLSDTSVANVSRKAMISTYDSTSLRPGDPILAVWVIKGLKPGTTRMKLAEGRTEKIGDANLRLKNFRIVVTE